MGNFFFKTIAEWYNSEINDSRLQYWNNLKNEYPELLNGINQPNDIPPHAGKIILDSNSKYMTVEPFTFDFKIPDPYINNIFLFPLSDLIYDKFTVITKLESITGRKADPKIIEGYVKYLNKQEELVKTKMPWVTI